MHNVSSAHDCRGHSQRRVPDEVCRATAAACVTRRLCADCGASINIWEVDVAALKLHRARCIMAPPGVVHKATRKRASKFTVSLNTAFDDVANMIVAYHDRCWLCPALQRSLKHIMAHPQGERSRVVLCSNDAALIDRPRRLPRHSRAVVGAVECGWPTGGWRSGLHLRFHIHVHDGRVSERVWRGGKCAVGVHWRVARQGGHSALGFVRKARVHCVRVC